MPKSTLSIWSFGNPVTRVRLFPRAGGVLRGAWSYREANKTRPEAGRFSPKPGVDTLVDDNLSMRGSDHSA